ncbi:tyrosine-type recombinase/integrase [Weissella tructae]
MASFEKRGNKFRAVVSYKDVRGIRRKTSKTFDKKKDATAWAIDTENKLKNGFDFSAAKKTFPDYFEDWIDTFKKKSIGAATLKKYKTWANVVSRLFEGIPLDKLSTPLLQQILDDFGETHSPLYMKNFVGAIKASLADAYIDGALERDIHSRLKAHGNKEHAHQDVNYLSAEEFQKLQAYLYSKEDAFHQHPFYLMVLIGLETGARSGEIQAMNTNAFNSDTSTITIIESWSTNISDYTGTKNDASDRHVTLSPELSAVINRYISGLEGPRWFKPINTGTTSKYMRKLVEEVGITPIRFHGLRHTHVSYLRYKGVDVEYVRSRVGHGSTRTTEAVYTHSLPEQTREQNKLALDILSDK